jgi:hypothetical protein
MQTPITFPPRLGRTCPLALVLSLATTPLLAQNIVGDDLALWAL